MSNNEENDNFIKIIYFDECSATDYLDISNGGKKEAVDIKKRENDKKFNGGIKANLEAKLNWFSKFKLAGEVKTDAEYSYLSNNLIKTTILNTVLTDYVYVARDDNQIKKFRNFKLMAYPESLSFMKMYAPYLIIGKDVNEQFDLSKLDEALKNARGYYELIASNDNEKYILRFNIKAFRNNYGISDLIKMNLTYHAIEVGEFSEERLKMQNEFTTPIKNITATEMLDGTVGTIDETILKVYDVILAGIE